jgi:hypothetical protein
MTWGREVPAYTRLLTEHYAKVLSANLVKEGPVYGASIRQDKAKIGMAEGIRRALSGRGVGWQRVVAKPLP